ncbi:MAG: hypothetical protein Q7T03_05455 [Deltaproteobacteria bacterium]|nr:hypothetical protein [Deltaproteobacteria bacterium]
MAHLKKIGFVFSFLFLLILFSAQAGTIKTNSKALLPSQPIATIPKTDLLKKPANQIPPLEKEFLENLLSKRVTYILGFGHPSPFHEAFFKEHFNDPQFRYGYPWIVTVDGKVPSNILEKMKPGAAAKDELQERVNRGRGQGEDIAAGVGIMGGMAQFCEFQKNSLQSTSQIMGKDVPEGMRLFGACPSDPQQCNRASGQERYREGSNMFVIGDKEECKNDRQAGVAGGDAEQRMQDQMNRHEQEQGAMAGRTDPCAPPEEQESNAIVGKLKGGLPDRSYAASGGGGTMAEKGVGGVVQSKLFSKNYATSQGSYNISYTERTYQDGSRDVIDYNIFENDSTRSEGKSSEVKALEAESERTNKEAQKATAEYMKDTNNKENERVFKEAADRANEAKAKLEAQLKKETAENLKKIEEDAKKKAAKTAKPTKAQCAKTPNLAGCSDAQCAPDSPGCDGDQGPELSAHSKQFADQLKQNSLNRQPLDRRTTAGNPGLEGEGGGLPAGPSLTDRWGAAGNPGSEGSANGPVGMNCDCKGKCGATPAAGFGTGRQRDPCTFSQDENCGQGEGPAIPDGMNPPGGSQEGGQPGGGIPIPR